MPVWRFKTMEEAAQKALWLPPGDPALGRCWESLSALSGLAPDCPPPRGVRKFRTIEEANADQDAWVQRRVDRCRRAQHVPDPNKPGFAGN